MKKIYFKLISLTIAIAFLCNDIAFAGGPQMLAPRCQISGLPHEIGLLYQRFLNNPVGLSPVEKERLRSYVKAHLQELPGSARTLFGNLLGNSDVRSHRFRKDLREGLEGGLVAAEYEEGRISQIMHRGLSWTDKYGIHLEDDNVFNIAVEVLNKILKKPEDERVTAEQVKAVTEYHEKIHMVLRQNRDAIHKVKNALTRNTNWKKLFECFQNQYGEYRSYDVLVEELIASYYTERILVNKLELLDGDRKISIDDIDLGISGIIEQFTNNLVNKIKLTEVQDRQVLKELNDARERKKRPAHPKEEPKPEPLTQPSPRGGEGENVSSPPRGEGERSSGEGGKKAPAPLPPPVRPVQRPFVQRPKFELPKDMKLEPIDPERLTEGMRIVIFDGGRLFQNGIALVTGFKDTENGRVALVRFEEIDRNMQILFSYLEGKVKRVIETEAETPAPAVGPAQVSAEPAPAAVEALPEPASEPGPAAEPEPVVKIGVTPFPEPPMPEAEPVATGTSAESAAEPDTAKGKEFLIFMLEQNKFEDKNIRPIPFTIKSEQGVAFGMVFIAFGEVKTTGYRATILSPILKPGTEYRIEYHFNVWLKKWICFVYEIRRDEAVSNPIAAFTGRVTKKGTFLQVLNPSQIRTCLLDMHKDEKKKRNVIPTRKEELPPAPEPVSASEPVVAAGGSAAVVLVQEKVKIQVTDKILTKCNRLLDRITTLVTKIRKISNELEGKSDVERDEKITLIRELYGEILAARNDVYTLSEEYTGIDNYFVAAESYLAQARIILDRAKIAIVSEPASTPAPALALEPVPEVLQAPESAPAPSAGQPALPAGESLEISTEAGRAQMRDMLLNNKFEDETYEPSPFRIKTISGQKKYRTEEGAILSFGKVGTYSMDIFNRGLKLDAVYRIDFNFNKEWGQWMCLVREVSEGGVVSEVPVTVFTGKKVDGKLVGIYQLKKDELGVFLYKRTQGANAAEGKETIRQMLEQEKFWDASHSPKPFKIMALPVKQKSSIVGQFYFGEIQLGNVKYKGFINSKILKPDTIYHVDHIFNAEWGRWICLVYEIAEDGSIMQEPITAFTGIKEDGKVAGLYQLEESELDNVIGRQAKGASQIPQMLEHNKFIDKDFRPKPFEIETNLYKSGEKYQYGRLYFGIAQLGEIIYRAEIVNKKLKPDVKCHIDFEFSEKWSQWICLVYDVIKDDEVTAVPVMAFTADIENRETRGLLQLDDNELESFLREKTIQTKEVPALATESEPALVEEISTEAGRAQMRDMLLNNKFEDEAYRPSPFVIEAKPYYNDAGELHTRYILFCSFKRTDYKYPAMIRTTDLKPYTHYKIEYYFSKTLGKWICFAHGIDKDGSIVERPSVAFTGQVEDSKTRFYRFTEKGFYERVKEYKPELPEDSDVIPGEIRTHEGQKQVMYMLTENKFKERTYQPQPFRIKAKPSHDKIGRYIFFGDVKEINYKAQLVGVELKPDTFYRINFYFSEVLKQWVGLVCEVMEDGSISEMPVTTFTSQEAGGKVILRNFHKQLKEDAMETWLSEIEESGKERLESRLTKTDNWEKVFAGFNEKEEQISVDGCTRTYKQLRDIYVRLYKAGIGNDNVQWEQIANEEAVPVETFQKMMLIYVSFVNGGDRQKMSEFLGIRKDSLIIYLSALELTDMTDKIMYADSKLNELILLLGRLQELPEKGEIKGILFKLLVCVFLEIDYELSRYCKKYKYLYMYSLAAERQVEKIKGLAGVVTERQVVEELKGMQSTDSLKDKGIGPRAIWKVILAYDQMVEDAATWKDKQELKDKRNYWRKLLWEIILKESTTGLGVLWKRMADRIGAEDVILRRAVFSYFLESGEGGLENMRKLSGNMYTVSVIKQELSNLDLYNDWFMIKALAKIKAGIALDVSEYNIVMEEFLKDKYRKDPNFPSFSYITRTKGTSVSAYITFYHKQTSGNIVSMRIQKDVKKYFGLQAYVRISNIFTNKYGWVFKINKIDPDSKEDMSGSPVMYFVKIKGKDELSPIDESAPELAPAPAEPVPTEPAPAELEPVPEVPQLPAAKAEAEVVPEEGMDVLAGEQQEAWLEDIVEDARITVMHMKQLLSNHERPVFLKDNRSFRERVYRIFAIYKEVIGRMGLKNDHPLVREIIALREEVIDRLQPSDRPTGPRPSEEPRPEPPAPAAPVAVAVPEPVPVLVPTQEAVPVPESAPAPEPESVPELVAAEPTTTPPVPAPKPASAQEAAPALAEPVPADEEEISFRQVQIRMEEFYNEEYKMRPFLVEAKRGKTHIGGREYRYNCIDFYFGEYEGGKKYSYRFHNRKLRPGSVCRVNFYFSKLWKKWVMFIYETDKNRKVIGSPVTAVTAIREGNRIKFFQLDNYELQYITRDVTRGPVQEDEVPAPALPEPPAQEPAAEVPQVLPLTQPSPLGGEGENVSSPTHAPRGYPGGDGEEINKSVPFSRKVESIIAAGFKNRTLNRGSAYSEISVICSKFGIAARERNPLRDEIARLYFTYRFYEVLKKIKKDIDKKTKGKNKDEITGIRRDHLLVLRSSRFKVEHRALEAKIDRYYARYKKDYRSCYEALFEINKGKITEIMGFEINYEKDICGTKDSSDILAWLKRTSKEIPDGLRIRAGVSGMYTLFRSNEIYMYFTGLDEGDYWMTFEEDGNKKYAVVWKSEEDSKKQGAEPVQKFKIAEGRKIFAQKLNGIPTELSPVPLIIGSRPLLIRKFLLENGQEPSGWEIEVRTNREKYGQITLCCSPDFKLEITSYLMEFVGRKLWITFEKDDKWNKYVIVWENEGKSKDAGNPYGYLRKYYMAKNGVVLNSWETDASGNGISTGRNPIVFTWKDHKKVIIEGEIVRPEEIADGSRIKLVTSGLFNKDPNIVKNAKAALSEWTTGERGVKKLLHVMSANDTGETGIARNSVILDILETFTINWQCIANHMELFKDYADTGIRTRALVLQEKIRSTTMPSEEELEKMIFSSPEIRLDAIHDSHMLVKFARELRGRNIPVETELLSKIYYKKRFLDYLRSINEEYKNVPIEEKKKLVCKRLSYTEVVQKNSTLANGIIRFYGYTQFFMQYKQAIQEIFGFEIDYHKDVTVENHARIEGFPKNTLREWLLGMTGEIPEGFLCRRKQWSMYIIDTKEITVELRTGISLLKESGEYWLSFGEESNGRDKMVYIWESEEHSKKPGAKPILQYYLVKNKKLLANKRDQILTGCVPELKTLEIKDDAELWGFTEKIIEEKGNYGWRLITKITGLKRNELIKRVIGYLLKREDGNLEKVAFLLHMTVNKLVSAYIKKYGIDMEDYAIPSEPPATGQPAEEIEVEAKAYYKEIFLEYVRQINEEAKSMEGDKKKKYICSRLVYAEAIKNKEINDIVVDIAQNFDSYAGIITECRQEIEAITGFEIDYQRDIASLESGGQRAEGVGVPGTELAEQPALSEGQDGVLPDVSRRIVGKGVTTILVKAKIGVTPFPSFPFSLIVAFPELDISPAYFEAKEGTEPVEVVPVAGTGAEPEPVSELGHIGSGDKEAKALTVSDVLYNLDIDPESLDPLYKPDRDLLCSDEFDLLLSQAADGKKDTLKQKYVERFSPLVKKCYELVLAGDLKKFPMYFWSGEKGKLHQAILTRYLFNEKLRFTMDEKTKTIDKRFLRDGQRKFLNEDQGVSDWNDFFVKYKLWGMLQHGVDEGKRVLECIKAAYPWAFDYNTPEGRHIHEHDFHQGVRMNNKADIEKAIRHIIEKHWHLIDPNKKSISQLLDPCNHYKIFEKFGVKDWDGLFEKEGLRAVSLCEFSRNIKRVLAAYYPWVFDLSRPEGQHLHEWLFDITSDNRWTRKGADEVIISAGRHIILKHMRLPEDRNTILAHVNKTALGKEGLTIGMFGQRFGYSFIAFLALCFPGMFPDKDSFEAYVLLHRFGHVDWDTVPPTYQKWFIEMLAIIAGRETVMDIKAIDFKREFPEFGNKSFYGLLEHYSRAIKIKTVGNRALEKIKKDILSNTKYPSLLSKFQKGDETPIKTVKRVLYEFGVGEKDSVITNVSKRIERMIARGFKDGTLNIKSASMAISRICREFGITGRIESPLRYEIARLFYTYRFYKVLEGIRNRINRETKGKGKDDADRIRKEKLKDLRYNRFGNWQRALQAKLDKYYRKYNYKYSSPYKAVFEINKKKIAKIMGFEIDYERDISGIKDSDDILKWFKGASKEVPDGLYIHVGRSGMYTLFRSDEIYMNFTGLDEGDYWMSFEQDDETGKNKFAVIWENESESKKQGAEPVQKYQIVKDGELLAQKLNKQFTGKEPIPLIIRGESSLIKNFMIEDGDVPPGFPAKVRRYTKSNNLLTLCASKDFSVRLSTGLAKYGGRNLWVSFEKDDKGSKYAILWKNEKASLDETNPLGYLLKYYLVKDGEVLAQVINGKKTGRRPTLYTKWENDARSLWERLKERKTILGAWEWKQIAEESNMGTVELAWLVIEYLGGQHKGDFDKVAGLLEMSWTTFLSSVIRRFKLGKKLDEVRKKYRVKGDLGDAADLEKAISREFEKGRAENVDARIVINRVCAEFGILKTSELRDEVARLFYTYRYYEVLKELSRDIKAKTARMKDKKKIEQYMRQRLKILRAENFGKYYRTICGQINTYYKKYSAEYGSAYKAFIEINKDRILNILSISEFTFDYKKDILGIKDTAYVFPWMEGKVKEAPKGFPIHAGKSRSYKLVRERHNKICMSFTGLAEGHYWMSFSEDETGKNKYAVVWGSEEESKREGAEPVQKFQVVKDGEILAQSMGRKPIVLIIENVPLLVKNFVVFEDGEVPPGFEKEVSSRKGQYKLSLSDFGGFRLHLSTGLTKYKGKKVWITFEKDEKGNKYAVLWRSKAKSEDAGNKDSYLLKFYLVKNKEILAQFINGKYTNKSPIICSKIYGIDPESLWKRLQERRDITGKWCWMQIAEEVEMPEEEFVKIIIKFLAEKYKGDKDKVARVLKMRNNTFASGIICKYNLQEVFESIGQEQKEKSKKKKHSPAFMWKFVQGYKTEDGKWLWARAAEKIGIEQKDLIKAIILHLIEQSNGDLNKTAEKLGISRQTLETEYITVYKLRPEINEIRMRIKRTEGAEPASIWKFMLRHKSKNGKFLWNYAARELGMRKDELIKIVIIYLAGQCKNEKDPIAEMAKMLGINKGSLLHEYVYPFELTEQIQEITAAKLGKPAAEEEVSAKNDPASLWELVKRHRADGKILWDSAARDAGIEKVKLVKDIVIYLGEQYEGDFEEKVAEALGMSWINLYNNIIWKYRLTVIVDKIREKYRQKTDLDKETRAGTGKPAAEGEVSPPKDDPTSLWELVKKHRAKGGKILWDSAARDAGIEKVKLVKDIVIYLAEQCEGNLDRMAEMLGIDRRGLVEDYLYASEYELADEVMAIKDKYKGKGPKKSEEEVAAPATEAAEVAPTARVRKKKAVPEPLTPTLSQRERGKIFPPPYGGEDVRSTGEGAGDEEVESAEPVQVIEEEAEDWGPAERAPTEKDLAAMAEVEVEAVIPVKKSEREKPLPRKPRAKTLTEKIKGFILGSVSLPPAHPAVIDSDGKLELVSDDDEDLEVYLTGLKEYAGDVWVSYQMAGDNRYAVVWQNKDAWEESDGTEGYVKRYLLADGQQVFAQEIKRSRTSEEPQKISVEDDEDLAVNLLGTAEEDKSRPFQRDATLSGKKERDKGAVWNWAKTADRTGFKVDGLMKIILPHIIKQRKGNTDEMARIVGIDKAALDRDYLERYNLREFRETVEKIYKLLQLASSVVTRMDNICKAMAGIKNKGEIDAKLAEIKKNYSLVEGSVKNIRTFIRVIGGLGDELRQAEEYLGKAEEYRSSGETIKTNLEQGVVIVGERSFKVDEIGEGMSCYYLLSCIKDNPQGKLAGQAEEALKLLTSPEKVIDIVKELDPRSWSPQFKERNRRLLRILDAVTKRVQVIDQPILVMMRAFGTYPDREISSLAGKIGAKCRAAVEAQEAEEREEWLEDEAERQTKKDIIAVQPVRTPTVRRDDEWMPPFVRKREKPEEPAEIEETAPADADIQLGADEAADEDARRKEEKEREERKEKREQKQKENLREVIGPLYSQNPAVATKDMYNKEDYVTTRAKIEADIEMERYMSIKIAGEGIRISKGPKKVEDKEVSEKYKELLDSLDDEEKEAMRRIGLLLVPPEDKTKLYYLRSKDKGKQYQITHTGKFLDSNKCIVITIPAFMELPVETIAKIVRRNIRLARERYIEQNDGEDLEEVVKTVLTKLQAGEEPESFVSKNHPVRKLLETLKKGDDMDEGVKSMPEFSLTMPELIGIWSIAVKKLYLDEEAKRILARVIIAAYIIKKYIKGHKGFIPSVKMQDFQRALCEENIGPFTIKLVENWHRIANSLAVIERKTTKEYVHDLAEQFSPNNSFALRFLARFHKMSETVYTGYSDDAEIILSEVKRNENEVRRNVVKKVYPALITVVRSVYPKLELVKMDVLTDAMIDGKCPENWSNLVTAMRADGIIDENDFELISNVGKIVDRDTRSKQLSSEDRTLLTEIISIRCLISRARFEKGFSSLLKTRLIEKGYGADADLIIMLLAGIKRRLARDGGRFTDYSDYRFVMGLGKLLNLKETICEGIGAPANVRVKTEKSKIKSKGQKSGAVTGRWADIFERKLKGGPEPCGSAGEEERHSGCVDGSV